MLCGSLDERRVWERLDTWICMAESIHCSPETITTLLISTIQDKKFFLKRQTMTKEKMKLKEKKKKTKTNKIKPKCFN